MQVLSKMPDAYLALAEKRVNFRLENYRQPEDFGYDFRAWVSPYTKGAHTLGSVAIVLQDWSGSDELSGECCPEIQKYGRTRSLKTNVRLEEILSSLFGIGVAETYGTNAFPFIKEGSLSQYLPVKDVLTASQHFLKQELEIAKPDLVIGLGRRAQSALASVGISHVAVPHPAARIGSTEKHEAEWRRALGKV